MSQELLDRTKKFAIDAACLCAGIPKPTTPVDSFNAVQAPSLQIIRYVYHYNQPTKPSQDIMAQFNSERAEFLRRVFSRARKGKTWFSLDIDTVAGEIAEPRDRIVAALGYLEERGDLIVEASGVRVGSREAPSAHQS